MNPCLQDLSFGKLERDSLVDIMDLDELKSNYAILKNQRDTYKLLLANYEKIFLQEGFAHETPMAPSFPQTKNMNPEPNLAVSNIETSTWSTIEKNSPHHKLLPPTENKDSIDLPESKPKKTEKLGDAAESKTISEKIELLGKEIRHLRGSLEEKNEMFQFSLNSNSELTFRKAQPSLPTINEANFHLSIPKKPKPSIDHQLDVRFDEEILNRGGWENDDMDRKSEKSVDSTSQMQTFFINMANKLKTLEEGNQALLNQLQSGATERDSLVRNIGDLKGELQKLSQALEEKTKENYNLQLEAFLEQQERKQTQKSSLCKNICSLI